MILLRLDLDAGRRDVVAVRGVVMVTYTNGQTRPVVLDGGVAELVDGGELVDVIAHRVVELREQTDCFDVAAGRGLTSCGKGDRTGQKDGDTSRSGPSPSLTLYHSPKGSHSKPKTVGRTDGRKCRARGARAARLPDADRLIRGSPT